MSRVRGKITCRPRTKGFGKMEKLCLFFFSRPDTAAGRTERSDEGAGGESDKKKNKKKRKHTAGSDLFVILVKKKV